MQHEPDAEKIPNKKLYLYETASSAAISRPNMNGGGINPYKKQNLKNHNQNIFWNSK